MCGIVAVLPVYEPATGQRSPEPVGGALEAAAAFATSGALDEATRSPRELESHLNALTELLEATVGELSTATAGFRLVSDPALRERAGRAGRVLDDALRRVDVWLDEEATHLGPDDVERLQ